MTTSFTNASDEQIIALVRSAKRRLVVIGPAFSIPVAEALATRMDDLPGLSLSLILDADPEVYRMGYGEVAALEIIRAAAAKCSFRLREQEGVRIGLVVSDDATMIYSPVSQNIEAGSTSADKPNAILLGGGVADAVSEKAGVPDEHGNAPEPEIGKASLSIERVEKTKDDLERNPPLPVDLTRKLNVFITRVQYVELKAKGYQLSRRRAELPQDFVGMASAELKERVTGRIRTPLDGIGALDVEIHVGDKTEKLKVDEKFLQKERQEIEKVLTHVMPKRGRVILRQDRASFDFQVKRFEAIVGAYQEALKEKLEEAREQFGTSFVEEFLERWKERPPSKFTRRLGSPSDEDLAQDIRAQADKLFSDIVKLDGPNVSVIYKDIAIEDLKDTDFMSGLRSIMEKGGVKPDDLNRLFEQGEAAPGQASFNLEGDAA